MHKRLFTIAAILFFVFSLTVSFAQGIIERNILIAQTSSVDEFEEFGNDDESKQEEVRTKKDKSDDEFDEFDESGSSDDEFEEFDDAGDSDDEFGEFDNNSESKSPDLVQKEIEAKRQEHLNHQLMIVLWVLFFTILAGVFVRFKALRHTRSIFLIAALIYLGFYTGGCPCPISSIQGVFLAIIGVDVPWQQMVWFLALIPITYIFGKVWCGWICHLGALQELLYLHGKFKFLSGYKTQKVMKIIRWVALAALIVQLLITKTNLFCKIDPFKVAFNFISVYHVGWYLLGLLILSSLFIYRPFCKAICPIGLVLGWVSKIPGASILGTNDKCTNCQVCSNTCRQDAIVNVSKKERMMDNKECIMCGDCIDSCKLGGLTFYRKGKKHNEKFIFHKGEFYTNYKSAHKHDNN